MAADGLQAEAAAEQADVDLGESIWALSGWHCVVNATRVVVIRGKLLSVGFSFRVGIKSRSYSKDLQIRAEHLNCSGFALSIDWGFRFDSLISARGQHGTGRVLVHDFQGS